MFLLLCELHAKIERSFLGLEREGAKEKEAGEIVSYLLTYQKRSGNFCRRTWLG
jgi:hypothetical protein